MDLVCRSGTKVEGGGRVFKKSVCRSGERFEKNPEGVGGVAF